jgi:hypothetical protein
MRQSLSIPSGCPKIRGHFRDRQRGPELHLPHPMLNFKGHRFEKDLRLAKTGGNRLPEWGLAVG